MYSKSVNNIGVLLLYRFMGYKNKLLAVIQVNKFYTTLPNFSNMTYKSGSAGHNGATFVVTETALQYIYEKQYCICHKLLMNSQTPRLRFFVLCFGFNQ
jgi:hypothetical protein